MTDTTALAERQEQMPATSGDDLLMAAVHKGADVETLERLMALRERMQAEQAQRAYYDALAAFQAECPAIDRRKGIPDRDGNVKYRYAPLDDIQAQVRELLRTHGFSYRFDTTPVEGGMQVACIATHREGHTERSVWVVPRVDVPKANAAQNSSASMTYGMRRTFCNVFGILTADTDTDGVEPGRPEPTITEEQAEALASIAADLGRTPERLLGWLSSKVGYDLTAIADLPARHFANAMGELKAMRKSA